MTSNPIERLSSTVHGDSSNNASGSKRAASSLLPPALVSKVLSRFNMYLRVSKRPAASSVVVETFWTVLWETVSEQVAQWHSATAPSGADLRSASLVFSETRELRGVSDESAARQQRPSSRQLEERCSRRGAEHHIHPQWLRVVVIPKFLALRVPQMPCCNTISPSTRLSSSAMPLPLAPKASSSSHSAASVMEVAKEFLQSFGLRQSSPPLHIDGAQMKSLDVNVRQVAYLVEARLQAHAAAAAAASNRCDVQTSIPIPTSGSSDVVVVFRLDDAQFLAKTTAECFGELAREEASGRHVNSSVAGGLSSNPLRCGAFGRLFTSQGVLDYHALSASGSRASIAGSVYGAMMRPGSCGGAYNLNPDVSHEAVKRAATPLGGIVNQRKPATPASSPLRDVTLQSRPATPNSSCAEGNAPELRKYRRELQELPQRPASSSSMSCTGSIGPSASQCCDEVEDAHAAAMFSNSTTTFDKTLWKAQRRKQELDKELADVQRCLERRLGPQVSQAIAAAAAAASGSSSGAPMTPTEPFDGARRSATALAFESRASECCRSVPRAQREGVMLGAIERHQQSVRRRELEEAVQAARRGHDDEQAVFARVTSELLRQEQSRRLRDDLLLQQLERRHHMSQDPKGVAAPTQIMRVIDVEPFVHPEAYREQQNASKAGSGNGDVSQSKPRHHQVRSVSALGSNPDDFVREKMEGKQKRRAYGQELDHQVDERRAMATQARELTRINQQHDTADTKRREDGAVAAEYAKKLSFQQHYIEAWDLQRSLSSLGP